MKVVIFGGTIEGRALASKDSGEPGGVTDKVIPALERGIQVIMIRRPTEG